MVSTALNALRERLDNLYKLFAERYLWTSMLSIPYYYKERFPGVSKKDLEVVAFLSAVYDFQMKVSLIKNRFITLIDELAKNGIKIIDLEDQNIAKTILGKVLKKNKYFHRFDRKGVLIPWLVKAAYDVDMEYAAQKHREHDRALIFSLWKCLKDEYMDKMGLEERKYIKRFLPKPDSNSPLKRTNLFLRWVVRDEFPDLGLWKDIDKSELFVPLGLEIARTAGRMFFGGDLEESRRNMFKITEILRQINEEDPIKYDYVLSRPPLLGICLKEHILSHCTICPLKDLCKSHMEEARNNPLYSSQKEYKTHKNQSWDRLLHKHNIIVKKTVRFLEKEGVISMELKCSFDYPIDHGLRPDIYCINSNIVLGEVKVSSEAVQGPQQLKVYYSELTAQGIKPWECIGVLSYGRLYDEDLPFILENVKILSLYSSFDEIYILEFSNKSSEPTKVLSKEEIEHEITQTSKFIM